MLSSRVLGPAFVALLLVSPAVHAQSTGVSDALRLQVTLDRAGFSPGEIDGRPGANTRRAREAFERSTGRTIADALRDAEPATTSYRITDEDAAGPFLEIPDDMMAKAKLSSLAYSSLLELLGERFHAAPAVLLRLNPGVAFEPGRTIVVPNAPPTPEAASSNGPVIVTVSKAASTLTVTDADGRVLHHAPATTGSAHDPLPIGEWTVKGVARDPAFAYNPDLFWDADPSHARARLPPGPNGPVGVVWVDLDKPHYGIHGTAEPSTIGHTASHGCVRLTNWDARTVAALVSPGTRVVFTD